MPTLEFDEVPARLGLPSNYTEFGQFSGTFDFDENGRVEVIRLDAKTMGKDQPIVLQPIRSATNEAMSFLHMLFVAIANAIEHRYRHVIFDALPMPTTDPNNEHRMRQKEFI